MPAARAPVEGNRGLAASTSLTQDYLMVPGVPSCMTASTVLAAVTSLCHTMVMAYPMHIAESKAPDSSLRPKGYRLYRNGCTFGVP